MKLLGIGLAGCSFSMWPVLIIAIYNNDNDQGGEPNQFSATPLENIGFRRLNICFRRQKAN